MCGELHTGHKLGDPVGDNNLVPLDQPHTLHAIYVMRCNLFHGAKSRYSDADSKLVLYAFQVLDYLMHSGGYLVEKWEPTRKMQEIKELEGAIDGDS